jgi:hypothetical protein
MRVSNFKIKLYKQNFSFFKNKKNNSFKRNRKKIRLKLKKENIHKLFNITKLNHELIHQIKNSFSYALKNKIDPNIESLTDFNTLNKNRRKYLNKLLFSTDINQQNYYNYFSINHTNIKISNSFNSFKFHILRKLKIFDFSNINLKRTIIYTQSQLLLSIINNPLILKSQIFHSFGMSNNIGVNSIQSTLNKVFLKNHIYTNLIPHYDFKKNLSKTVLNSFKNNFFQENIIS